MSEVVVFFDESAAAAVGRAAAFFEANGLRVTHRTQFSVAVSESVSNSGGGGEVWHAASEMPGASGGQSAALRIGGSTPGEGHLPPGAAQVAAVPVQLRPEWCRAWVTAHDSGRIAEVASAFVDAHRERSRRVEAEVRALETDVYSEASWPAYEATLRASLQRNGTSGADLEAKITAFKQRWLALGRRAAKAPPEEHLSA